MKASRLASSFAILILISSLFTVGAHAEATVSVPSYASMIDGLWRALEAFLPGADIHPVVIAVTLCMLAVGIALILFPAKLVKHFYSLLFALLGFAFIFGARDALADILPFLTSAPLLIYALAAVGAVIAVLLAHFLFRISLLIGTVVIFCVYVAPLITAILPFLQPFAVPIAAILGILVGYVFAFSLTKVFYVLLSSVSSAFFIAFALVTLAEQLLLDMGMLPSHIDALLWTVTAMMLAIALIIRFFDKRRKESEYWEP